MSRVKQIFADAERSTMDLFRKSSTSSYGIGDHSNQSLPIFFAREKEPSEISAGENSSFIRPPLGIKKDDNSF